MCKFNNRLFVFSLLSTMALFHQVRAKPVLKQEQQSPESLLDFNELMALTALLTPQDNYDLHYDQRQKGEENYRLKLDGFVIGFPQEDSSALLLFTDDLLENFDEDLLMTSGKNKQPSPTAITHPERPTNENLEIYGKPLQIMPSKPDAASSLVVEIPVPKKQGEARHRVDDMEEFPSSKTNSRTKEYISHLLSLLKRGRRN